MSNPDYKQIIENWINDTNSHDITKYLSYFADDAVIDDPSVGRAFENKKGITEYFELFFIGYKTKTRLVSIEPEQEHYHVEVDFTGDFPGGQTGGIFDITFAQDKITLVKADLL